MVTCCAPLKVPPAGEMTGRAFAVLRQKAVNVDLVTLAHIDLAVGDDGNRELDRWSRIVAIGVLIAVVKFLRDVSGVKCIQNRDPFEVYKSVIKAHTIPFCVPLDETTGWLPEMSKWPMIAPWPS